MKETKPMAKAAGGRKPGAAVGALLGLARQGVAELIDPRLEDVYWQQHYLQRPYVDFGARYEDYGPAYRYGLQAYTAGGGRSFAQAEPELAAGWDEAREESELAWHDARHAVRDAWLRAQERIEQALPGDADGGPLMGDRK